MSKSQEQAFLQAVASVSLETKSLTSEMISLLRQAVIDETPPSELLDIIEAIS